MEKIMVVKDRSDKSLSHFDALRPSFDTKELTHHEQISVWLRRSTVYIYSNVAVLTQFDVVLECWFLVNKIVQTWARHIF